MHFTILCLGSHGDIRPFVALGVELCKQGHRVRIATEVKEEKFCREWGLDYAPLEGDLNSVVLPQEAKGFDKIQFMRTLVRRMNQLVDQQFETLLPVLKETDAILYHPVVVAAPHLAEK